MTQNITVEDFRKHKKEKTKFACLTAYDASLSRLMSEAGVELILVGDSLGMVVQGHDSTIPVSMEDLLYHLRCVKRGNSGSHIMADMPFMSYATENLAYDNAMRLMQAGANSVKVEGGEWILKTTELLSQRGIPVCAHLGLTPQSINRLGGYYVQGRDLEDKNRILSEAKQLEDAGAEIILLECVPAILAEEISSILKVPTIGIGAGSATDGQIMVCYDVIGAYSWDHQPKFVKNFMNEANSISEAFKTYVSEVKNLNFPSAENSF
ncbi:MAG: 3-methyl-2-oxobutanoate hydroxymethyltransferase [Gammaproteobacteria bacterium]|tara:strand:- start:6208 stop:7005 length:798 start_codon:yes stop_codon:yes gene_type:complete